MNPDRPSDPGSPVQGRILIIGTRDVVAILREKLSRLSDCAYDLNEIGHILIDSAHSTVEIGPEEYARQRDDFAEHFARQHRSNHDEYTYAFQIYDEFYDAIQERVFRTRAEEMGGLDFCGFSFNRWVGDDLVVTQHRTPY